MAVFFICTTRVVEEEGLGMMVGPPFIYLGDDRLCHILRNFKVAMAKGLLKVFT